MTGGRRILWTVVAVLAVAVVASAGYRFLWPLLNPEVVATARPADPDCRLHQDACTAVLPDGGRLTFALRPRPIFALQKMTMEADIEGVEALGMEVDFTGVDMNMGFNRFPMEAAGDGRFEGTAVLPVCVRSRMEWNARVLVRTPRGRVAFPFRFESIAPEDAR